jgi:hypothetical protein
MPLSWVKGAGVYFRWSSFLSWPSFPASHEKQVKRCGRLNNRRLPRDRSKPNASCFVTLSDPRIASSIGEISAGGHWLQVIVRLTIRCYRRSCVYQQAEGNKSPYDGGVIPTIVPADDFHIDQYDDCPQLGSRGNSAASHIPVW